MNIYIACNDPWKTINPYVASLVEEIREKHKDVKFLTGPSLFWKKEVFDVDIIHIQWPHQLIIGHSADKFSIRLDEIKSKGIKIVSTCHNFVPHYSSNEDEIASYSIVYAKSDITLHLGEYSKAIFETKYPTTKHLLFYHHVYEKKYTPIDERKLAIETLGLPEAKKYVLSFGYFRNDEERRLIIAASKTCKDVVFIAPSFYRLPGIHEFFKYIKVLFCYLKSKIKYPQIVTRLGFVNDKDLLLYFAASDVVLLQRLQILNSGNIPLGMLMGKVVVGPDTGNAGWLLKKTGNPVFKGEQDIPNALELAFTLTNEGKGKENRAFALENFSTSHIAEYLYEIYSELNGK